ncbi:MAG TPA: hypothetical protein VN653_11810, partial [Anaerolineales bacterium]|nr:hypothetical protein [Anaerolineales bacterium]
MTTQNDLKPIHVRQAVFDAVRVWKRRQEGLTDFGEDGGGYPPAESILQAIPRRQQSVPPDERKLWIPYVEPLVIRNTFGQNLRRLFAWLRVILTV